ncbi:MAG: hypothetical protein ACOYUZ_05675 [Patescibacteria group bacterium]
MPMLWTGWPDVDREAPSGYSYCMNHNPIYPLMTHCPICHALFAAADVKLISETKCIRLYHSTCHSCGHGLFAYVMETNGGMSSIGLVTDAAGEDALRLADSEPVSSKECINAHRQINEQSRELCRRFLDISGKLA